jgi:hypothetical protein
MRTRLPSVVGALVFLVVAFAGCGGSSSAANGVDSKTPEQIVAAAKAAADNAASVHLAGSLLSEGKPIRIDMELLARKGGQGHIDIDGLTIKLIRVERAVYVSGSAALYAQIVGAKAARRLQGVWIKAPVKGSSFATLAALTELTQLVDQALAAHGALRKGPLKTIAGRQAVSVEDVSNGGTLYVAATGKPYPIEIVQKGGSLSFDNWNRPVTLTAPANAINVNQLQSGH